MNDFELNSFFEITPDLVCIAGKDGYFKKVNPAVAHTLGYTIEELHASPIASFMHPDDKELTLKNREELFSGKALLNFVNRYVAKSGKTVWLEWTSIYYPEKQVVFAIAKDVTARKQVEKEVEEKYKKFKSLATYFKSSIEKDRKYLAYELHEELAQLVSAVKMDIDWIAQNMPNLPDSSKTRVDHALAVSGMMIKSIQRISFAISPKMLDDFGLSATLDWLCKEFSILNDIPCKFVSAYNEKSMSHEIKLDFFRICQEALTNAIEPANAGKMTVKIADQGTNIIFTITDEGKGFDAELQKPNNVFNNIRERAASINGNLEVLHEKGEGTIISVSVAKEVEV